MENNMASLKNKVASLESQVDMLETEITYVNELLVQCGFPDGIHALKKAIEEILYTQE